jgi:tRNA threonylcarbamoyladenosine biosynthesis protein TsaB
MRILGIDSTTPKSSVALVEQNKVLAETHLHPLTKHSNRILALVDQVLAQSGVSLDAVDAFAVTRGPGSFTGLRVGVSLVQGLVLATGKPCIGVDTLEAVAASAGPTHRQICPCLDARKNQIYAAFFKTSGHRLQRTTADCAIEPVQFCEQVTEPTLFLGYGLEAYGDLFARNLGPLFLTQPGEPGSTVAASVAKLAGERLASKTEPGLETLTIKYVRKSEAELNFEKKYSFTGRS